jgi:hypothetical protein
MVSIEIKIKKLKALREFGKLDLENDRSTLMCSMMGSEMRRYYVD